MIVEPTRSWHAQESSEHTSTRADPRVQEPTRPERPNYDRPLEQTFLSGAQRGKGLYIRAKTFCEYTLTVSIYRKDFYLILFFFGSN